VSVVSAVAAGTVLLLAARERGDSRAFLSLGQRAEINRSALRQATAGVSPAVGTEEVLLTLPRNQLRGGIRRSEASANSLSSKGLFLGALGCAAGVAAGAAASGRAKARRQVAAKLVAPAWPASPLRHWKAEDSRWRSQFGAATARHAFGPGEAAVISQLASDPAVAAALDAVQASPQALAEAAAQLLALLGPVQPAGAAEVPENANSALASISAFFFDPRLQWDANGNVLLDPQGNPLPDNLWTQFVAFQATLIKRLDEGFAGAGIPGSFGCAVAVYTLLIRTALYPLVKGQLETTAKIQVLAPRVNELKEKYKDDQERLNQEVGLLYMDLQIDPLGAILPLLFQLPVFWGLYRAIRRLAIVEYPHLKEGFLWIPSLYGPNMKPDPSFDWLTQWQGPLISLHPKLGWTDFGLYLLLPITIFFTYRLVLAEALADPASPKLLQATPFLLAFITLELPQAMGIYIAMNIASSMALTQYTKDSISSKIPGYDEFVKTGKWPPGVDPEKVLAQAFGVKRLTEDNERGLQEPSSVPEAVFAGRADFIPILLEQGRLIDEFDDRGIPASAYTLALNSPELLERLFELGASPMVVDKRGNNLLHYCAGYGRDAFLPVLLQKGAMELMDKLNEDGQSPLDVARVNLAQDKVADDVRKLITLLEAEGATGKTTTKEDEAMYEELREKKKREDQVKSARAALKALAMAAQQSNDALEGAAAAASPADSTASPEEAASSSHRPSPIAESLDRVKLLDIDRLRERLGGKLSEEQLKKLSERLAQMSPEDLANYAAGMPSMKAATAEAAEAEAANAAARASPEPAVEETRRESVIVD